jgi:hypothetical protein
VTACGSLNQLHEIPTQQKIKTKTKGKTSFSSGVGRERVSGNVRYVFCYHSKHVSKLNALLIFLFSWSYLLYSVRQWQFDFLWILELECVHYNYKRPRK